MASQPTRSRSSSDDRNEEEIDDYMLKAGLRRADSEQEQEILEAMQDEANQAEIIDAISAVELGITAGSKNAAPEIAYEPKGGNSLLHAIQDGDDKRLEHLLALGHAVVTPEALALGLKSTNAKVRELVKTYGAEEQSTPGSSIDLPPGAVVVKRSDAAGAISVKSQVAMKAPPLGIPSPKIGPMVIPLPGTGPSGSKNASAAASPRLGGLAGPPLSSSAPTSPRLLALAASGFPLTAPALSAAGSSVDAAAFGSLDGGLALGPSALAAAPLVLSPVGGISHSNFTPQQVGVQLLPTAHVHPAATSASGTGGGALSSPLSSLGAGIATTSNISPPLKLRAVLSPQASSSAAAIGALASPPSATSVLSVSAPGSSEARSLQAAVAHYHDRPHHHPGVNSLTGQASPAAAAAAASMAAAGPFFDQKAGVPPGHGVLRESLLARDWETVRHLVSMLDFSVLKHDLELAETLGADASLLELLKTRASANAPATPSAGATSSSSAPLSATPGKGKADQPLLFPVSSPSAVGSAGNALPGAASAGATGLPGARSPYPSNITATLNRVLSDLTEGQLPIAAAASTGSLAAQQPAGGEVQGEAEAEVSTPALGLPSDDNGSAAPSQATYSFLSRLVAAGSGREQSQPRPTAHQAAGDDLTGTGGLASLVSGGGGEHKKTPESPTSGTHTSSVSASESSVLLSSSAAAAGAGSGPLGGGGLDDTNPHHHIRSHNNQRNNAETSSSFSGGGEAGATAPAAAVAALLRTPPLGPQPALSSDANTLLATVVSPISVAEIGMALGAGISSAERPPRVRGDDQQ